jgi:hypothetical protein
MGRPLSDESVIQLSLMDAIIAADAALAKKRAAIEAAVAEYKALTEYRACLRAVNASVAA